ncbi:MAG TPA: hypothetical protein VF556_08730 [Pyrinomonadaceae bacterium]
MGIDAWKTKEAELFDLDFADEMTDSQMRNLAFNEKEVEAFISKIGKEIGINKIVLDFTYDKDSNSER